MKDAINSFVSGNYKFCVALGFIVAVGGVVLALVTNDADPWGPIGGYMSAFGLGFSMYAVVLRSVSL